MKFLSKAQVLFVQKANVDRFGGAHGVRDEGTLESAVLSARNRYDYEGADIVVCAATYGFHLCQAHAFVDGNKRIAAASMLLCLELNAATHDLSQEDVINIFLRIASSEMSRNELEAFLRAHVR